MKNTSKTIEEKIQELLRSDDDLNFALDYIPDIQWNKILEFIKEALSEQDRISREIEQIRIIEQVKNSRDIIPEIYYLRMVEIIKTNKE